VTLGGVVWHCSCRCRRLLNESESSGLHSPGVVVMAMVLRMECYWWLAGDGTYRGQLSDCGVGIRVLSCWPCWLLVVVLRYRIRINQSAYAAKQLHLAPHYVPPWPPPLLLTSNLFSMHPCKHTTTKLRTNFSITLLPLSYNPATHTTPSSLSSKT
jgi:hypothetical protein